MTRTNKWTVHEAASQPKWFTHHGHPNCDPTKVKKEGAGRGNWGRPGDELTDEEMGNRFGKSKRRNSNHVHQENELRMLDEQLNKDLE
ncbi:ATPase-stabilizing factor 15 kDa protein [[Candida] anglica]|uniref:ATPase-stabilizing factor 15 kDa protein n=1 Tax=[Candida] anglica TaxID=148631 RepID=A0ABP0ECW1_9ASCO